MQPSARAAALPPMADLRNVLVFRALQLGDLLCAVPALRALRAGLPQAHIALVGLPWAAQFVQRFHALVDEFIAFPGHTSLPEIPSDMHGWSGFRQHMRERRADLAIQLHGSGQQSNAIVREFGARRIAGFTPDPAADGAGFVMYPTRGPESDRLLALPAALGFPVSDRRLEFPLHAADDQELTEAGVPALLDGRPYICVHPGARSADRRWPVDAFAAVADHFADAFGWQIVLTGSGDEYLLARQVAQRMRFSAVNAALPLSVGAMAALMEGARLLVCNDTGVSHLAAALQLPSVVVFRRDDLERWAPADRQRHRCLVDPDGSKVACVIAAARSLAANAPLQLRCRAARD